MTFPVTLFGGTPAPVAFLARSSSIQMLSIEGNFGFGSGWTGSNFTYTGTHPFDRGYPSWQGATPQSMPAAFLSQIVVAGFDTMRIVIDPGPLNYGLQTSTPTFNALMAQIQVAIGLNTAAGLRTLVDLSCRPTSSVQATGAGLTDDEVLAAAPSGAAWTNYLAMVRAVATYVAAHNLPANVAIEMFNEPPPGHSWATHAPAMWAQARAGAPGFTIFVAGDGYAGVSGLTALTASDYDANTCFVLHFYSPYEFCFVAQPGAPSDMQYVAALEFPPVATNQTARIGDATAAINADGTLTSGQKTTAIAAMTSAINAYYTNGQMPAVLRDQAWITAQLDPAATWATAQSVAGSRCIIGEFGANGSSVYNRAGAPGGSDSSVTNFYQAILGWAASKGFNWGVFSGRDAPTFGNGLTIAPGGTTPLFNNARLLGLGLNPVADPNAFIVAPSTATPPGNDSNAGTLAAPFLTVHKATTAMTASGTKKKTYVRGGTIVETAVYTIGAGQTLEIYPLDAPGSATITNSVSGSGANAVANITLKGLNFRGTANDGGGVVSFIDCAGLEILDCDLVITGYQQCVNIYRPGGGLQIQGCNWTGPTIGTSGLNGNFLCNIIVNNSANYNDPAGYVISDNTSTGGTFPIQIQDQSGGVGIWANWHVDRNHGTGWGDPSSSRGNIGISFVGSKNASNHSNTCTGNSMTPRAGLSNSVVIEAGTAGCTYAQNSGATNYGFSIAATPNSLYDGNNLTVSVNAFSNDGGYSSTGIQIGTNTVNGVVASGPSDPNQLCTLTPLPSTTGLPTNTPSEPYP